MDTAPTSSQASTRDCSGSDDSDNVDADAHNYLYSLVYHDTANLPPADRLPFFVDRTGADTTTASSGCTFEVVNVSDQCENPIAAIPPPITTVHETPTEVEEKQPKLQEKPKKKRKRIEADGGSISVKVGNAKKRVIDRLKLLAAAATSSNGGPMSSSASTSTSAPSSSRGAEMCFLRVIDDRLKRHSDSSEDDDSRLSPSTAEPPLPAVTLGVKSTAHHAPAFIRVHQGDLDDFLAEMRPDKTLWRVDADDLTCGSALSSARRRFATAGRYFGAAEAPLDPMDAECAVCQKRGHFAEACKRTGPVCILCGQEGHSKVQCPSRLCPLCLGRGHQPDSCRRYVPLLRYPCTRCGCLGHWRDQCPEIWRQYHSTVVPGSPIQPSFSGGGHRPEEAVEDDSKSEADSGAAGGKSKAAGGGSRLCCHIGQFCRLTYCCNCAQAGHSVHECILPKSSLNRCLGSFHSQRVSRYDDVDPFTNAARASRPSSVGWLRRVEAAPSAAADYAPSDATGAAAKAEHLHGDLAPAKAHLAAAAADDEEQQLLLQRRRPAPVVGESFIPLTQQRTYGQEHQQQQQQQPRRRLTFRQELEQLRDLARRLLPDGTSRSQIKKLTNRLKFWRRNGYQPSTPEQEDQMAHRMEEWVLEVADSHNYLHKLNFKRRCRLLNSTGATLELIRSCRQFGEPPAAAAAAGKARRNRQPKAAAEPPAPGPAPGPEVGQTVRAKKKQKKSPAGTSSSSSSSWLGRLRSRAGASCSAAGAGETSAAAAAAVKPRKRHRKAQEEPEKQAGSKAPAMKKKRRKRSRKSDGSAGQLAL